MAEFFQYCRHAVNRVRHAAMRFEQQFDPEFGRPLHWRTQFFHHRKNLFTARELFAEFCLGIALGGDDLLDSEQRGQADGLDDFVRAVKIR